jgi:hypothetical protein
MARDDDEAPRVSRFSRGAGRAKRPSKPVPFPGAPGEKVRLWAPTDDDEQLAEVAARQHLTGALKLSALDLSLAAESALFRAEYERQLLFRVLRDPDDATQSYFESVEELREGVEAPQRDALVRELRLWRAERYPELQLLDLPAEQRAGKGLLGLLADLKAAGALSTWWQSCGADTQYATLDRLVEASTSATPPSSSDT